MENNEEDSVTYIIEGPVESVVKTVKYVDMPDSELVMHVDRSPYALAVWMRRLKDRETPEA